MEKTKHKRNLTFVATIILLVFSVCFLSSCAKDTGVSQPSTQLYLNGLEYEPGSATIYAIVTLKGKPEQLIVGQNSKRSADIADDNMWYQTSSTTYTVSTAVLSGAVNARVTPEDRNQNGIEYDLKVVFRYDTIYKSITSNGEVKKTGKIYHHSLLLEGLNDSSLNLQRSVPKSANWYAMLIGCGLIAGALGVATTLVVKRKKWQKEKEKDE